MIGRGVSFFTGSKPAPPGLIAARAIPQYYVPGNNETPDKVISKVQEMIDAGQPALARNLRELFEAAKKSGGGVAGWAFVQGDGMRNMRGTSLAPYVLIATRNGESVVAVAQGAQWEETDTRLLRARPRVAADFDSNRYPEKVTFRFARQDNGLYLSATTGFPCEYIQPKGTPDIWGTFDNSQPMHRLLLQLTLDVHRAFAAQHGPTMIKLIPKGLEERDYLSRLGFEASSNVMILKINPNNSAQ